MIWVYSYFIGLVIAICIAGFITRGHDLKEDDMGPLIGITAFWPLFAGIALLIGPPVLLFMLCKGELDEPIKEGLDVLKAKWKALGD